MQKTITGKVRNPLSNHNPNRLTNTMKLMIVFATTEGHTGSIAEFLKHEAEKNGHSVGLFHTNVRPPSPDGYDAVIIAASIHAGKYQASVEHYIREHHTQLNKMLSIFISVSLTAASEDRESWDELKHQTEEFLISTGWNPDRVEYEAGALLYTKYDFMKRFIMRMISKKSGGDTDTSHDHVYTDWDRLKTIIEHLESAGYSDV